MCDEHWRRIDELFHAALDHPAAERISLLRRSCGDDLELRLTIERLLAADEATPDFMEKPASEEAEQLMARYKARLLPPDVIDEHQVDP